MNNGSLLFTRVCVGEFDLGEGGGVCGKKMFHTQHTHTHTCLNRRTLCGSGQSKPPGQIHMYAVQRTGYAGIVRANGSVGEETADIHRGTGKHVPAENQRVGRNALLRTGGRGHAKAQDPVAQGKNAVPAAVFLSPFARLFRNENSACKPFCDCACNIVITERRTCRLKRNRFEIGFPTGFAQPRSQVEITFQLRDRTVAYRYKLHLSRI